MGEAVWVISEGEEGDDWDHSLVLRQDKVLNGIARRLGKTEFTDLLDFSVIAAEYDGEIEVNYVAPSVALDTLETLVVRTKDNNSA